MKRSTKTPKHRKIDSLLKAWIRLLVTAAERRLREELGARLAKAERRIAELEAERLSHTSSFPPRAHHPALWLDDNGVPRPMINPNHITF